MKRACICDEVGHLLLQPVSTLVHPPGRGILTPTPRGDHEQARTADHPQNGRAQLFTSSHGACQRSA
jgi:hypothetical protein